MIYGLLAASRDAATLDRALESGLEGAILDSAAYRRYADRRSREAPLG